MKAKKIWLIVKEDTNNESAMLGKFAYIEKAKAITIFDFTLRKLCNSLPSYMIKKSVTPTWIEWYDKNSERKVKLYLHELTLLEE
jgi:hypothetical protein